MVEREGEKRAEVAWERGGRRVQPRIQKWWAGFRNQVSLIFNFKLFVFLQTSVKISINTKNLSDYWIENRLERRRGV